MSTRALLVAIAVALLLPMTQPAKAVVPTAPVGSAAVPAVLEAPPAVEMFMVGSMRVQRYGDHGRPLILIPGLEGGSWVWRSAIEHFRRDHVVYAVTLAGFDGLPLPADRTHLMDQADASLEQLVRAQHLDHPVLIGHSLGGTLAIRFATEHSDEIGGVVAVDGLPIMPGFDRVTADQRKAFTERMVNAVASATPQEFQAQVLGFMQNVGTIDPAKAALYAPLNGRSDQAAVAEYLREDAHTDLRPGLKNVGAPLLEVSPYYAPDFSKAPASSAKAPEKGASKYFTMTEAQKAGYYESLLAGAPDARVISIAPSRHFVMLDQPEALNAAIASFLRQL